MVDQGKEMLDRLSKEIASEILSKRKDPNYKPHLDRHECSVRLSRIMEIPSFEVEKMMDEKISKYLRSSEIYRS